jgi:ribose/xylose/arabinose/galactoside ABC-type transport system permease subunit
MTATSTTTYPTRIASCAARFLESEHLVLWLALAYFVALLPFTPELAQPDGIRNLLLALLPLFVVAIGQTMVLISGGIDLSVCSTMALASVLGAMAMNNENGWFAGSTLAVPLGILVMLGVGIAVGACNATAVALLRMPPFIVTLTMMMFFSGFAIWLTQSRTINGLPPAFNALGANLAFVLPIGLLLGATAQWLLGRSLAGRWLYAVGGNPRTALVSGVPVGIVTGGTYVVSGGFAAVAAMLYTGQAEAASPVLGQRLLLDVIAATVIGGTSLFGGRGKVLWTLFGVLLIKLIDNTLNLLNFSLFAISMVKGGVILLAALLDALRTRRQQSGS